MAKSREIAYPKRGQVYLVRFDPTLGAEIQKTRPALILQSNIANRLSPMTIVAAITSRIKGPTYLTRILVKAGEGGLKTDSVVLLNQIRSVDKLRLGKRLGKLKPETMKKVDRGLQIGLGLVEI